MKALRALTLSLALAAVTPLAAFGQMEPMHPDAAMVEAADTPEEHAALAEHYHQLAGEARKKAEQHRAMGERYGGKVMKKSQMRQHCREIASLQEKMAAEYERLAAGHEAEAGQ